MADEHAGADSVLKLVLVLAVGVVQDPILAAVLVRDPILAVVLVGILDLVQALVLVQGRLLKSHHGLVLSPFPQAWLHPQHILSVLR